MANPDLRLPENDKNNRIMSDNEVKAEIGKVIQDKITPELLKYFTREEAHDLIRTFYHTSAHSYANTFTIDRPETKKFLAREIRGKKILELGSNGNPDYKLRLMKLGAKDYEFADPKYNADGLTALVRHPDESAIVCSFALFADPILYPCIQDGTDPDIFDRYRKELIRQMYRVTPKKGITFHGIDDWCLGDLENGGFIVEDAVPEEMRLSRGGLKRVVLRKK